MISESKEQLQLALRIQKRILSEVRQNWAETQQKLEEEQEQVKIALDRIVQLHETLGKMPAEIEERDILIKMLQDRLRGKGISNVNQIEFLEAVSEESRRYAITSEDVAKVIGVHYDALNKIRAKQIGAVK